MTRWMAIFLGSSALAGAAAGLGAPALRHVSEPIGLLLLGAVLLIGASHGRRLLRVRGRAVGP